MLCLSLLGQQAIAQDRDRPSRIGGKPNLNGIWQAMNTAYWNLEGHSAEAIEELWQFGAIGAIPAGQSVVVGGEIPYLPEALAKRAQNQAGWPAADASCSRNQSRFMVIGRPMMRRWYSAAASKC